MKAVDTSWINKKLYPFSPHYFNTANGKIHYVDEGEGSPILFVHGTPTWSFLYRDFIKAFAKTHRCIAPDHLGFGLSDKPENFRGFPQDHAHNLKELILHLNLQNITLVVHDFGGPIGLGAALEMPERIERVVLMNTWLWETKNDKAALKVDKIINSFLGKLLYLRFNFSPKVLLKKAYADKKLLTKEIHRHYIQPYPKKNSRYGLYNIGQALVGASGWYQEQWEKLDVLLSKPWLVLWGIKDAFITPNYLEKWKERMPNATIKKLETGHFVQEEASEEVVDVLKKFLMVIKN